MNHEEVPAALCFRYQMIHPSSVKSAALLPLSTGKPALGTDSKGNQAGGYPPQDSPYGKRLSY